MENDYTAAPNTFILGSAALNTFILGCQDIYDTYETMMFPEAAKIRNTVIDQMETGRGAKFVRICRIERVIDTHEVCANSVHCFVALNDGSNKKLGSYSAGDVFKATGWNGIAKGARGNIFDENHGLGRMGEYGPEYNK